jgi:putative hydrolase of the HAD superfamily
MTGRAGWRRWRGSRGGRRPRSRRPSGFEDEADRGALSSDAYLAGFAQRLGRPFGRDDWIANRKAAMTPWPAMLELAREFAAVSEVAVLSNNGHLTAEAIDELFPQLRPIFGEQIHVSARLGLAKPDPAIYRAVLSRFSARPEEALFIDDLAVNVAGAEAAGLHGHVLAGRHDDGGAAAAAGLRARLTALA